MIPYFQVTKLSMGPFSLQAWGTLAAIGFLAGIIVAYQEAKKRGINANQILEISPWVILSSLLGARLFYIIGNISFFLEEPLAMLKVWEGGMAFYGGLFGALVALVIFTRKKKIPFWDLVEPIMFVLPLGIFFGRMGCFLIHDHIGKITTVPWGIEYIDGIVRHEPSLYGSLSGLLLFIIFLVLRRFPWSNRKGFFTTFFMLWYGVTRFIFDFFRSDDLTISDSRWFGLTFAQYSCILLFIIGLYLLKHYLISFPKEQKYEEKH